MPPIVTNWPTIKLWAAEVVAVAVVVEELILVIETAASEFFNVPSTVNSLLEAESDAFLAMVKAELLLNTNVFPVTTFVIPEAVV